jgi:hypothetical protein
MTTTPTIEEQRDGAYRERACLLAWLATQHPAVIAPAPDVDEPGWQILYLAPAGQQMTWHIAPADSALFEHVEHVPADDPRAQWDGHTTAEKYERIRGLPAATSAYKDVVMNRTLGRGVRVQTAPEHALLSLALLRDPGAYISEVSPGHLLLADQVEYQVTGYDSESCALTLRLVNDFRLPAPTAAAPSTDTEG